MKGLAYTGLRKVEGSWVNIEKGPRALKPKGCVKCGTSLVKFCSQLAEEERKDTFDTFWIYLDWEQRKVYVIYLVEIVGVKRRTINSGTSTRHVSNTGKYFLWKGNERISVCKRMFLSTLGIGEKNS